MSGQVFRMIEQLRLHEEIVLYDQFLTVQEVEKQPIVDFLHAEYLQERIAYPAKAPAFDPEAAWWGAQIVYLAAQLVLHREHKDQSPEEAVPLYRGDQSAGAQVSADLCLRFLPALVEHLVVLDKEDPMVQFFSKLLSSWSYSALAGKTMPEGLEIPVPKDECLKRLMADRITQYNHLNVAQQAAWEPIILADLGDYPNELWPGYQKEEA